MEFLQSTLEPVSKLLVLRKHKNINVKWTNIIQRSPMHFGKNRTINPKS
ncbi:hypothetical protein LEP1GSC056_4201 [Leptospira borgpetersenii str. Brem 328]|uniref:Uncharacterized protein n=1 Tax=Leptospira borgpetersenii str. Brem 328 TaxID=1049780 RepID=A0ABC9SEK5_LEPBO|nr:hypothetical protein LEP1GSC056_4201 [Leptospira borgpetersenii str. Brem 328]